MLELEPNFSRGYWLLGIESWAKGRYQQAISEFEKVDLAYRNISGLGCLYGMVGERQKAQQALHEMQRLSAKRYVSRFDFAIVYAGLGEMDRAFEYLEQAYEQHEGSLIQLRNAVRDIPRLGADPRMADLLRRLGFPE